MIKNEHAKRNDITKNIRNEGVSRPENYGNLVTGHMSLTLREGLKK
jgi:hypothetical protein